MYNFGETHNTTLTTINTNDEDKEDSIFEVLPLLLLDLREAIDEFRLGCADTVLAESFNDDCEELKIIMPYIRYVTHNFITKETGHDYNRGVPGYITKDIHDMFISNGEEQADTIATAHKVLADRVMEAFVNIGYIDVGGIIPYDFVKRLSPDAFLFATPWATITSPTGDDRDAIPLLSPELKVRQDNPERYADLVKMMVEAKAKKAKE